MWFHLEKLFRIENLMKGVRMGLIAKLLQMVLGQASPAIKEAIVTALKEWKIKAAATDNPWDDLIVEFIMYLIGEE